MRALILSSLAACLLAISATTIWAAAAQAAVPKGIVADAPYPASHELIASDGTRTTLAKVADGAPLAVIIMKGTHCRVCSAELARLAKHTAALEKLGAKVVGLSADDPAAHAALIMTTRLPFEILTDEDGAMLKSLGSWTPRGDEPVPGVLWFDRCGVLKETYPGRWPGRVQTEMILERLRLLAPPTVCGRAGHGQGA